METSAIRIVLVEDHLLTRVGLKTVIGRTQDIKVVQQEIYKRVFEKMTLVVDEKHAHEAVKIVPSCWGLIVVGIRDGAPYADEIWPARTNRELDPLAIAQLLWREEIMELMQYFDLDQGNKSKSRKLLWQVLAKKLTVDQLKAFVCYKLKQRNKWKARKKSRI